MCRVANLAFLKPNFEIQAFFDALGFFLKIKIPVKIWPFFQSERLGSGKTLFEMHIHHNFFRQASMTIQGANNIAKILLLT